MYRTCLFCHHDLGWNEVIEPFPVGRRLAFDQTAGRLWVVCRHCEKWNLTPFEERWEAIEECERRFRDARKRVTSDQIGLARLDAGLDLVRIGAPLRPEFAAWRYGDQFGRRRRRTLLLVAGASVAGGGLLAAGAWAGLLGGASYGIWQAGDWTYRKIRDRQVIARVPGGPGRLVVRRDHLPGLHFLSGGKFGGEWGLSVEHDDGTTILTGETARRAAVLLMPRINRGGAPRRGVEAAVSLIEQAGEPDQFLRTEANLSRYESESLPGLDLPTRLAIEMAVNEQHERHALEGELALLELEWREAAEIAAIADRLGVPEEVEGQLERLKRTLGNRPEGPGVFQGRQVP